MPVLPKDESVMTSDGLVGVSAFPEMSRDR